MQIDFKLLAIAGILIGGFLYIQSNRIDSLKNDVSTLTTTVENQAKSIDSLKNDFKNIQVLEDSRSKLREQNIKGAAKLSKDSKRVDIVVKKPHLVEIQLNRSFNSFAEAIQEASK